MSRKPSGGNLATIAKELNLSISTVSRALRDAEGIHSQTRERVVKRAEAIGYKLPGRLSALHTRPHNIMALAQCSTPYSDWRYLRGISRAAVPLNLAILSHHVGMDEVASVLDPKLQPAAMRSGAVEGLVLIHRWPPDIAARLSEKWPTVSIVHHYPDAAIDLVGIDDRIGIGGLVRRFREAGHRKIGFFGFCREMSWSCSRFAAYVETMASMDLPYEPSDVIKITLEEALATGIFNADEWAQRVMARHKSGVHAWICASSGTAVTLCRFFSDAGLRIPQDVEVAGYHQDTARSDMPSLTSTQVADEDLGAAALRRLVHRLQHPHESQRSILLPATFVQGESTSPPARASD
jgi:DNA-binding LacI/PurR family transcriptional regulator